jgi:uncharacterized membrane protein
MDSGLWVWLHGAVIHFPVALSVLAVFCDTAAWCSEPRPAAVRLFAAGGYALYLAALGSAPAVVSGLVLTRGEMLGHGALRWHHLFAWPAWGLLVALAVARVLQADTPTRRERAVSLAGVWLMAVLMGGAGHWGGLLTRSFP